MPSPRTFSITEAGDEPYKLDPEDASKVFVYRFGRSAESRDWISRRRQNNGNFGAAAGIQDMNSLALGQSSFGSSATNVEDNPFILVATDIVSLKNNGEGWVANILSTVPNLGKFSVPFENLFRPRPV